MNILHQARDAFQLARGVEFESGMDYPFYHAINELILKYSSNALPAIRRVMNQSTPPSTIHFTLREIGRIEDPGSIYSRLAFIVSYLNHPSAEVRDGAALGIANLDHPVAIPLLKKAISRETLRGLQTDMIQVLNQLERKPMPPKPTLAELIAVDQPKPVRTERSYPVNHAMINYALIHFSDPVLDAIEARIKLGFDRYGTYLHTHDGRDTLTEIWQEIVDALYYSTKGTLEAPALSVELGQCRFTRQVLTALIKVLSCWGDLSPDQCWVSSITKVSLANTPPTDRRVVLMLDRSSPDAQLRNKWTAGYFDDGEWYRSDDGRKVAVECWAEIPDLSGMGL